MHSDAPPLPPAAAAAAAAAARPLPGFSSCLLLEGVATQLDNVFMPLHYSAAVPVSTGMWRWEAAARLQRQERAGGWKLHTVGWGSIFTMLHEHIKSLQAPFGDGWRG